MFSHSHRILYILFIDITVSVSARCPDNWTASPRTNSCYKLIRRSVAWANAKRFCEETFSGNLAILSDKNEQNFIKAKFLADVGGDCVWLGASDVTEGQWRWVDGSEMVTGKYSWKPGNPNNGPDVFDLPLIPGEDCLAIIPGPRYHGRLNDKHCKKTCPSVCQLHSQSSSDVTRITETQTTPQNSHHSIDSTSDNYSSSSATVIVIVVVVVVVVVSVIVTSGIVAVVVYRRRNNIHQYEDTSRPVGGFVENEYSCLENSVRANNQYDDISGTDNASEYYADVDIAKMNPLPHCERNNIEGHDSGKGFAPNLPHLSRLQEVKEKNTKQTLQDVPNGRAALVTPSSSRVPTETGNGDSDWFTESGYVKVDDVKSVYTKRPDGPVRPVRHKPPKPRKQPPDLATERIEDGGKMLAVSPRLDSLGYLALDE